MTRLEVRLIKIGRAEEFNKRLQDIIDRGVYAHHKGGNGIMQGLLNYIP
jgi:hypothetical protein